VVQHVHVHVEPPHLAAINKARTTGRARQLRVCAVRQQGVTRVRLVKICSASADSQAKTQLVVAEQNLAVATCTPGTCLPALSDK
jgi:hypothetical protein